jgi:hypothetical protein
VQLNANNSYGNIGVVLTGWCPTQTALHRYRVGVNNGSGVVTAGEFCADTVAGLILGTSGPNVSTLDVRGSVSTATVTKTISYTLGISDRSVRFNCTSGPLTGTLPAGSAALGREYHLYKTDTSANALTVALTGTDTFMDGTSTKTISSAGGLFVQSDGGSPAIWAFK